MLPRSRRDHKSCASSWVFVMGLGLGAPVTPSTVLALFRNYGVRGVLALMIGLLIISIIVIAVCGIEPANRRLEDLETAHG
jgi:MFS transporter, putative metabolite:H+ symporter